MGVGPEGTKGTHTHTGSLAGVDTGGHFLFSRPLVGIEQADSAAILEPVPTSGDCIPCVDVIILMSAREYSLSHSHSQSANSLEEAGLGKIR